MDLKTRLAATLILLVTVPISILSFTQLLNAEQRITSETLLRIDTIANIQKERILDSIERNDDRLSQFQTRSIFKNDLDRYNKNKDAEALKAISSSINSLLASSTIFKEVTVIDPDGIVVASTDPSAIGKNERTSDFFIIGKERNKVDTIFKEGNESRLLLSGPLLLDGKLVGVIVIKTIPKIIISIVGDYTGLGETGETVFVKKDENGDAIFLAPLRHDPNAAFNRKVTKDQTNAPATQALAGIEDIFTNTVDHRGKNVFSSTRFIDETGWGIVAKIDKDEALAEIRNLRTYVLLISVFIILVTTAIAVNISGSISDPIRKLENVADAISKGDMNAKIDPEVKALKNEIGSLANAFDRTVVSLKLSLGESEPKESKPERKK